MIRTILRLLLVAGFCSAATAYADAPVRIDLHSSAALAGTHYTLGDVADVDAADAGLRQRLVALTIGAVPRQGYTETISRSQIEAFVRQQVRLADTEWNGASEVRIHGQGQHIAAEELADIAARTLGAALEAESVAIDLQPVGHRDGFNVPAGILAVEARLPAQQALAKRMSVLVDVRVDGQIYTTIPIWFAVRATRQALVARVALRPGEPLRAQDFALQSIDVTGSASPVLPPDAVIDEMRLRRALEPGMSLAAANVEPRPPVARSEQVMVRVVQGAVTIETTATALADARVGEIVKVKNPNTNESYVARVVGPGTVVVGAR